MGASSGPLCPILAEHLLQHDRHFADRRALNRERARDVPLLVAPLHRVQQHHGHAHIAALVGFVLAPARPTKERTHGAKYELMSASTTSSPSASFRVRCFVRITASCPTTSSASCSQLSYWSLTVSPAFGVATIPVEMSSFLIYFCPISAAWLFVCSIQWRANTLRLPMR